MRTGSAVDSEYTTAPAPEELICRDELARRLGIHERTVRRMVERGELPRACVGNGGRPRWLWGYVLDYCRKQHENHAKLDRKVRRELK